MSEFSTRIATIDKINTSSQRMLDPPSKISPAARLPPPLPRGGDVDVSGPSPPPVSSTCQRSPSGVRLGILVTDSSRQTVSRASQPIVQAMSAAIHVEPKP